MYTSCIFTRQKTCAKVYYRKIGNGAMQQKQFPSGNCFFMLKFPLGKLSIPKELKEMIDCKNAFQLLRQSTEAQPLSELRGRASIRSRAEALAQFDVVATSSTGYCLSLKHKKSNNPGNRLYNGSFFCCRKGGRK